MLPKPLATTKLLAALAVGLAASILLNIAAGAAIVRMLEERGKAGERLETARQDAIAHRLTLDKVRAADAECRRQLGTLRQAAQLALDQRDVAQATLDGVLASEAEAREQLYRNNAECGAMARCRVCDPIADRLRNPPRPRPADRGG